MTGQLRSYSLLRFQARHGNHRGENSADLEVSRREFVERIGKHVTVVGVENVYWKIRVGFSEFRDELVRIGLVDVIPQSLASTVGCGYILWSWLSMGRGTEGDQYSVQRMTPIRRETHLRGSVLNPDFTSSGRCARRAPNALMV